MAESGSKVMAIDTSECLWRIEIKNPAESLGFLLCIEGLTAWCD